MMKTENTRSRLLVLVPEEELDEAKYAQKARSLAEQLDLDIVFLGMVNSQETESLIRRKLVTLSGIASTGSSNSRFTEFKHHNWLEMSKREFKPGDYILCPKESNAADALYKAGEVLNSQFGNNVFFTSGIITPNSREKFEEVTKQVLNWAGVLIILVTAFIVEAGVDGQTSGWVRIVCEIVLVGLEIVILWMWNLFVSRLNYK
jgi:hypothetical protein